MPDWVITIPKTVPWEEYQKELDFVEENKDVLLNYRLPYQPKAKPGEMCYVVHDGYIRGWMAIKKVGYFIGFQCTITAEEWPDGHYIQRGGKFHKIDPVKMTGFRGIRKLDLTEAKQ